MTTYVALFRGINVGGRHILPMGDLKRMLEQHGCLDVQTYIQSGNAIFRNTMTDTDSLTKRIAGAIATARGLHTRRIRHVQTRPAHREAPRRGRDGAKLAHHHDAP
jgi:uncharacterized protein (DUF1697 family)